MVYKQLTSKTTGRSSPPAISFTKLRISWRSFRLYATVDVDDVNISGWRRSGESSCYVIEGNELTTNGMVKSVLELVDDRHAYLTGLRK